MEKEKKKIGCSYALLVIVLFATVCFLADYIVIDRKLNENKGGSSTDGNVSENVNNSGNDSSNVLGNDVSNIEQKQELIIKDLMYDGSENITSVKIIDGNILIEGNGKSVKYLSENAVGLYYITHHEGENHLLYYVTSDNKLYQIGRIGSFINENDSDYYLSIEGYKPSPRLLADNVSGFIYNNGECGQKSTRGYVFGYEYISVMTVNNTVQNIYLNVGYNYGAFEHNFVEEDN